MITVRFFIPRQISLIRAASLAWGLVAWQARPQARLNLKFLAWPDPPMYIPSLLSGQARPTLVAWLQYDIHFSSEHFET
jgi:hypothetical protein